jgi:hypothetical protein
MQGRRYPIFDFEPSLSFLQLISSPWSKNDVTLVAGGWDSLAGPRVQWMITDPEAPTRVFGNVSAADNQGRIASFDTLLASTDSLAERIKTFVPRDVSVDETNRRLARLEQQAIHARQVNAGVFYGVGVLLVILVALRLVLVSQRTRSREKAMQSEAPMAAHP